MLACSNFTSVRESPGEVVKTKLGMRLFGAGLHSVQSEFVSTTISEALDALFAGPDMVTVDAIEKKKQEVFQILTQTDVLNTLPERRLVEVQYLSTTCHARHPSSKMVC